MTYPESGGATYYVTYAYDELSRLRTIDDMDGSNIVTYEYDALSRRQLAHYANGTTASYEFDLIGQLKVLTNETEDVTHKYAYSYDAVGNRKTMTA